MTTQNLAEHVLLITLPAEPSLSCELEAAVRAVDTGPQHDVIVSFALAEVLPSTTLCNLIILDRRLGDAKRRLILCSVPPDIASVFRRLGLHSLFRFAENEAAALQALDRETDTDE